MLSQDVVDSLFPPDLPEPEHWEQRYPPRDLPEEAKVTRFSPSPTGYLHIGGVYAATIDVDVARQSGGVYFVRLEDTDQARVTEGAAAQFAEAFAYFSIGPDEDDQTGHYGPYPAVRAGGDLPDLRPRTAAPGPRLPVFRDQAGPRGDHRAAAGRGRPARLLRQVGDLARRRSGAGDASGWRPATRTWCGSAPRGSPGGRVSFTDAIRGELTLDDNRNDAVILKSSDAEPRLPTYHFAHAVDDHLMRVTLVIRGEEWISSVPLHLQLFDALGFPRVQYAHIALLMKQDGGSRRKLSKRRDPEATVELLHRAGLPGSGGAVLPARPGQRPARRDAAGRGAGRADPAVRMRHRGPAGGHGQAGRHLRRLHRHPARRADPGRGHAPGRSATLPTWPTVLAAERELALRALAIEREGVANPRKDLRKWADFRAVYGYFFPQLFEPVTDPADASLRRPGPGPGARGRHGRSPTATSRRAPETDWFDQIRRLAADLGFAPSQKVYKQDPAAYRGSIREASQVIRVLLTGTPRSPDLAAGGRGARHR